MLAAAALAATACFAKTTQPATTQATTEPYDGPIIDIHQHTNYHGRSNAALLHHQMRMGATQTILLPSGSPVKTESTLKGIANGLYAGAGGIDTVVPIAEQHPGEYFFMANEVPDLPDARATLEKYLKRGAKGIGEQKFNLPCDSKEMELIYSIAQDFKVPVLMHFQYENFNTGFENFGKVLAKWKKVTFIGHAQTFWGNIDAKLDQKVLYPRTKVTPGGLTERYLSEHDNLYGDLSAGSGLNSMTRDEDHARRFLDRHQDRLMFGSDCADPAGFGPTCQGANIISCVRRLAPNLSVVRKILHDNARQLFNL
jgi:predicted TIM-barrel fold metal-dependent hydrolase